MDVMERMMRRLGFDAPPPATPENGKARELLEAGRRAKLAEQYDEALVMLDEAVALATSRGDRAMVAVVGLHKADVFIAQERWQDAEAFLRQLVKEAEQTSQEAQLSYTLSAIGALAQAQGDWDRARASYEKALDVARAGNSNGAEGRALGHLADTYLQENNASYAAHLLREALPKLNMSGDIELSSYFVGLLGQALIASGQDFEGDQLLSRALRLAEQMQCRTFERHWTRALGERAQRQGRSKEAYDYFKRALAEQSKPSRSYASALTQISNVCLSLQQETEALAYAEEAIRISPALGDPALDNTARTSLGLALRANGRSTEAIPHLQATADFYEQAAGEANRHLRVEVLRHLAAALTETGDDEQALATYERAVHVADALKAPLELAQTRRDLGVLYSRRGDLQAAIREWTEALAIYEEAKLHAQTARLYCDIADARRLLGQGQRAMKDYEQALMVLSSVQDDQTRGLVLSNAANAYVDQGDIQSAEAFFAESILIAQRTGDEVAEATRRGNRGWFLLVTGRAQEAVAVLRYALQMSQRLNLTLQRAVQTDNLGLAYDALGDFKAALPYHQQALELLNTIKSPHWEAIFKANQGNTLLTLGNLDEATTLFEDALATGRATHDIEVTVRALTGMAQAVLQRQQPQNAEKLVHEAMEIARRADMRRLLADALSVYSQQQAAVNESERAAALWEEAKKLFSILQTPQAKIRPAWLNAAE